MSVIGTLISFTLSWIIWSFILPVFTSYAVKEGFAEGFAGFFITSIVGAILLLIFWSFTGMVLTALGEPITEWSWGWPGYIAINYTLPSISN